MEEAARELSSFGLTGNQARAYIALVKLGVAPVSKIAQLSKIRREEIYRMMPKLERLGLVEKILGKPVKYKPVPLKDILSILFKRERETAHRKIAELREKRRRLLKQLRSLRVKKRVDEEEGPHFVLILDREQAIRKIVTMIQKAKKKIAIATSNGAQLEYSYGDVFRKAVRKGVKARIILQINELDDFTIKILRKAELLKDAVELRHIDNLIFDVVIVDSAEAMVGTFSKPTSERHVDLWTNNSAYVDGIKWAFDRVWQDAVDIRSRIDYLQTGKPIERTEVIRGRENLYKRIFAGLSRTKLNLFTIGNGTALGLFKRDFKSASMELKKRGVRIRLLTNINEDNLEVAEEIAKHFEVRHLDRIPMRAVLGDEEIGFSWIPVKEMPQAAIYSNNREIVQMIWDMAENAWNNAVDAQARIDEIRKGKPIGRVSKPIMEYISKKQKTKM